MECKFFTALTIEFEISEEHHYSYIMTKLLRTNQNGISQVFCHVAARLNSEGAEKTWDQCRIKLKNLKSQYRYIKVCILQY